MLFTIHFRFLLFINACSFLSSPHISFYPSLLPFAWSFALSFLLYHHPVAQGRVWALRQVNPSSDNDRFEGEGGREEALRHSPSHQPQHLHSNVDPQEQLDHEDLSQIHQSHDPAESCGQCSLPSRPWLEPKNEHQAHISSSDIPEEQVSQLQSNQAHHHHQHNLTSSPPHPQPHLECVFRGSDLVDWLIERGLCAGRAEARLYGVRLQLGGVFDHLTGRHSFRDEPTLLYHFTQGRGEGCMWEEVRRKEKDEVEKEEVPIGNHYGCRKQKCFMVQLFHQALNTVSGKAIVLKWMKQTVYKGSWKNLTSPLLIVLALIDWFLRLFRVVASCMSPHASP